MFKKVASVLCKTIEQHGVLVRQMATRKRFYKKCHVIQSNGCFEVALDQRKLKTPKGNPFLVESEPLALAIATEWEAQKEKINQSSMHLTGLSWTAMDNPDRLTKEDLTEELVSYLESDTILFPSEEDSDLYEQQKKYWIPVAEWLCQRYHVKIMPSSNIMGPTITDEDKDKIRRHFLSYNLPAVFGFRFAIEALKSVALGLACVDRYLTIEDATRLSRLEEEYQSQRWGRVEWAHDLNEQGTRARVAAGVLFVHCNSSQYLLRNKLKSG